MADQIFPDSIIVGPNNGNNNGAIILDGNFDQNSAARLTIGGVGREGRLRLRDSNNRGTMVVSADDFEVPVLIGGGPRSGRVQLFRRNGGGTTIDLDGSGGNIVLGSDPINGNPGQDGDLILRNGAGSLSIILEGSSGNCQCVSHTQTSDLRFKKNIVPLSNALDKILSMRGVSYQWQEIGPLKHVFSEKSQIGFIGQEMEDICPEVVHTNSDGYKSLNYSRLTPILVEAMKEQQQVIEQQSSALADALAKLEQIQTTLQSIGE